MEETVVLIDPTGRSVLRQALKLKYRSDELLVRANALAERVDALLKKESDPTRS